LSATYAAGLAMAHEFLDAARDRRRAVDAPTWSPSSEPPPPSSRASSPMEGEWSELVTAE
jgi:hypothetical protein